MTLRAERSEMGLDQRSGSRNKPPPHSFSGNHQIYRFSTQGTQLRFGLCG